MIFEPPLLPQLNEKREKGEKKSMKKQCKTAEGGKTNGFDSWETLYPVL